MLRLQDQLLSNDRHFQEKDPDGHVKGTVPSHEQAGRPSLGELSAAAEEEKENDGFRTPTSTEHKIPAVTECPPAPRKRTGTRAIPMKRRTIFSKLPRRRLQFDEFEVLIPPKVLATVLSRLMKPPK